MFRSTDGGTSWNEADSGLPAIWGSVLVIDPINRGTVYVVTYIDGVWKSTDGGNSWQVANAGLPDGFLVNAWAIDPQRPGTLYAAGILKNSRRAAVFKSLDGGASWNEADAGLPLANLESRPESRCERGYCPRGRDPQRLRLSEQSERFHGGLERRLPYRPTPLSMG